MKAAHFGSMDVNYRPEMVHLRENNKWEKADFIDSKMLRNRVEHLDSRNLSSQYEKDIEVSIFLVSLQLYVIVVMIIPTRRLPSVWKTPSHDADYTTHVSPAFFGIESQTGPVILIYVHFSNIITNQCHK